MRILNSKILPALCVATFVSGCISTPVEIRNQSALTAAHISAVTSGLNRFATAEKRATQVRANRILALHAEMDALDELREMRMTSSQKSQVKSLLTAMEATAKKHDETVKKRRLLEADVNGSVVTFTVPKTPLNKTQKILADLSAKTSRKAKFAFLKDFAKVVAKDYKEQRKKSETAAMVADGDSSANAKAVEEKANEVMK